jgi:hypothetical protein
MNEPERPMHPALIAVVVVLGIAFVGCLPVSSGMSWPDAFVASVAIVCVAFLAWRAGRAIWRVGP